MVRWLFGYFQVLSSYIYKNKCFLLNIDYTRPIRIELGSGNRKMLGWIGIDMTDSSDITMVIENKIPFQNDTVDEIYTSHMLEHFYYREMVDVLKECLRILKPGGRIRIAVPDASIYISGYFNANEFNVSHYCRYQPGYHKNSRIDIINYIAFVNMYHRYMFDGENLVLVLEKVGFENVELEEFRPEIDNPDRKYESIYAVGHK